MPIFYGLCSQHVGAVKLLQAFRAFMFFIVFGDFKVFRVLRLFSLFLLYFRYGQEWTIWGRQSVLGEFGKQKQKYYYVQCKIMKKVNLSSTLYKQPTPPKQKKPQPQTAPQSSTTQSICCPNCRYLFKMPKQPIKTIKTPTHTNNHNRLLFSKNNDKLKEEFKEDNKIVRDVEVQTEQVMGEQVQTEQVRTSPKRERLLKGIDRLGKSEISEIRREHVRRVDFEEERRGTMTDRTPEHSPYFFEQGQRAKSPLLTERQGKSKIASNALYELQSSRRMDSSNKSNQKISNLPKSKQNPQFPTRSIYLNPKSITQTSQKKLAPPSPSPSSSSYFPYPPPTQNKKSVSGGISHQQRQQRHTSSQSQNRLAKQLLNSIQLTQQIQEIISYNLNLSQEMSIPSYCKMLMYEMKDKQKEKDEGREGHRERDKQGEKGEKGEESAIFGLVEDYNKGDRISGYQNSGRENNVSRLLNF